MLDMSVRASELKIPVDEDCAAQEKLMELSPDETFTSELKKKKKIPAELLVLRLKLTALEPVMISFAQINMQAHPPKG